MTGEHSEYRTYRVQLRLGGNPLEIALELPAGSIRLAEFAYAVVDLGGLLADIAQRDAARLGHEVSCTKGCAACCRQLVPISPAEAFMVAELMDVWSPDAGDRYRRRFQEIETAIQAHSLADDLERLRDPLLTDAGHRRIARSYFQLGMPCPFLEEEVCSIYEDRPATCREYMVLSPADYCSDPFAKPVRGLPLSVRLSEALARVSASRLGGAAHLLPLSRALPWARAHASESVSTWDAYALLEDLMYQLNRSADAPDPDA